jgi:hypothetical protein
MISRHFGVAGVDPINRNYATVRAVDGEIATLVERRMARRRWRHMIERIWNRIRSLLREVSRVA